MIQKLRNDKKGFTLIELMIVIAIIGILAAIAVPQFLAYRMRSYNTAAKAVANNLRADSANLNSELGVYGHTDGVLFSELNAEYIDDAAEVYGDPTDADNPIGRAASPNVAGIRIVGQTFDTDREMAVGIAIGPMMWVSVVDINDDTDNSSANSGARHMKGDTAYASDTDVENILFSVSNPTDWPNDDENIGFILPDPGLDGDDIDEETGSTGDLNSTWSRVR